MRSGGFFVVSFAVARIRRGVLRGASAGVRLIIAVYSTARNRFMFSLRYACVSIKVDGKVLCCREQEKKKFDFL